MTTRPFSRARLLALALGLVLVGVGIALLSDRAASGAGGAKDDGPRVGRVTTRVIDRAFTGDDGGALRLDREVLIEGRGFFGTSFGPDVRFVAADGTRSEAVLVVLESGSRIVACPPPGLRGPMRLEVVNPDARTALATVSF